MSVKLPNGKELRDVTNLEELQEVKNGARDKMYQLRDAFNERGDKSKGQPGKFEGDEKRDWDAANSLYDAVDARMQELRNEDNINKRCQEIAEEANRSHSETVQRRDINDPRVTPEITPQLKRLAFQGWLCAEMGGELDERQEEAMNALRVSHRRQLRVGGFDTASIRKMQLAARTNNHAELGTALEERAMSAVTATSGAEFVPEGFVRMLEINQLAYSGIMQAGDIMRTNGGGDLPWPTMDDTGNKGELLGESASIGASVDPTTGNVILGAYKFSSKPVLVPYELLEDADLAPNLPQILANALGERLGRIKEQYYTTGTGTAQPQGIVTAASVGVTAAATNAITADDILRLEHSVDPAYRNGAAYMMHDSILLLVRLLKDSEGQYLWQSGLKDGVPDRLNGRMLYINQEMADTLAADADAMLFGQLTKHKIREVNSTRIYRLQERYRDNDQDGFVAFCRGDSRLLNAGTNPVKKYRMAAS